MNREEFAAFEAGRRAFHANRSLDEMPSATKAEAPLKDAWTKGWQREMDTLQSHHRAFMENMSRKPASRCEMSSRGPKADEDGPAGPGPC